MICLTMLARYWQDGQRLAAPAGLWNFLRVNAPLIGRYFDAVQIPNDQKTQSGAHATGDGFGVYDPRDLGTKPQQGSVATLWGTLEEEMAAIAALHAHGVEVWGMIVAHQRVGENGGPGVFQYLGADMRTKNGRGATTAGWFRGKCNPIKDEHGNIIGWHDPIPPFSPQDPCPSPRDDNAFGREICHKNCNPPGASLEDARDTHNWRKWRTGKDGDSFDDVKGTYEWAVQSIMDAVGGPFVSEYYDGNPVNLDWWATSPPMNERSAVYDFTGRFHIKDACNGFDARLFDQGYSAHRPDLSVGFLDNHDTDSSPGQQVVFNKAIAYALLLNMPLRRADVYGKDFFGPSPTAYPEAYGLAEHISNIAWFAGMFAIGGYAKRWQDKDVYAYTRDGNGGSSWSGGCLVAVNFNTLTPRTITVQTMWHEGQWVHDYSGHCPDATVGAGGRLTVSLPSNAYSAGLSFGLWAPGGVNKPLPVVPRSTTQTFICELDADGKPDLDVTPIKNGLNAMPQRIFCGKGTVSLHLTFKRGKAVPTDATIQIELLGMYEERVAWGTTGLQDSAQCSVKLTDASALGWHTIRAVGNLLPAAGVPFELSVTYMGMEGL